VTRGDSSDEHVPVEALYFSARVMAQVLREA
jgi:hypothetical protein